MRIAWDKISKFEAKQNWLKRQTCIVIAKSYQHTIKFVFVLSDHQRSNHIPVGFMNNALDSWIHSFSPWIKWYFQPWHHPSLTWASPHTKKALNNKRLWMYFAFSGSNSLHTQKKEAYHANKSRSKKPFIDSHYLPESFHNITQFPYFAFGLLWQLKIKTSIQTQSKLLVILRLSFKRWRFDIIIWGSLWACMAVGEMLWDVYFSTRRLNTI